MQITVKSTKVLKTGTGEYGEWVMVKVEANEGEYVTFADNAQDIQPGSVINITDMDEDEKGKKFKKYEVIEKGQVSSSPEAKPNGDMTNDMWAEKDNITRTSIERQVSAKIAFEHTEFEVDKTLEIAEQIYQWISGQSTSPKPSPERTESRKEPSEPEKSTLQNVGELFTRAQQYGLNQRDVLSAAGVNTKEDITDFEKAWEDTAKKFAAKIQGVDK